MAFEIKNGVLNKYNAESGEIRVIVPDEVTKINKEAFKNCTNIASSLVSIISDCILGSIPVAPLIAHLISDEAGFSFG